MNELQKLLDKRATAWAQYQEILGRAGDDGFSAEDAAALDTAEKEIRKLSDDIERLQRADALARGFDEPAGPGGPPEPTRDDDPSGEGDGAYTRAFESYVRYGFGALDAEQRAALQAGWRSESKRANENPQSTDDAAGGFTIPPAFRTKLIEALKSFTPLRPFCEVITTETGATLPWPTNDDTGNEGVIVGENTDVGETNVTFADNEIGAFMFSSRVVRASLQIIQDTFLDLGGFIGRKLGERIGRRQSRAFTVGTGNSEPLGLATGGSIGKDDVAETFGGANPMFWEVLVDLEHSVDPAYRVQGRTRWMLHDKTLAVARKEKDADDRPIWNPSVQAGVPDLLLGKPYIINNDMPEIGAGNRSVAYGDFEAGYLIRDVLAILFRRLEERYAEFLQVGFLSFQRSDGTPQDTNAYKVLRHAGGS